MSVMKCAALAMVCTMLAGPSSVHGARLSTSPLTRVVSLLMDLKSKVELDGQAEQQSYDKFACWCEKTMERKATDINNGKARWGVLETRIGETMAAIATHKAEIAQLKTDISTNKEEQNEATTMRNKENSAFEIEKIENEQCTGALEAAIGALTGAGAKKGFLQVDKEVEMLSVAAGLRNVMQRPSLTDSVSQEDLEVLNRFVTHPDHFFTSQTAMSAVQVSQNPFGDYAPQSTQIQGILKGMYDAFTADIEKDNAEESDKQKGFEELMATKVLELGTLTGDLGTHETLHATAEKQLSDDTTELDDTKAQLKADEVFFEDTKENCKVKANEWATRTRLRTEELAGMAEGIKILSGGESTFAEAHTTFLQVGSSSGKYRMEAFKRLKTLATRFKSLSLARIAATVKTGGHFDKVITMIDDMIALLRNEEQDDIAHRDRCQAGESQNEANMADLASDIAKAEAKLTKMGNTIGTLGAEVGQLEIDMNNTQTDMGTLLSLRNTDVSEYRRAVKVDAESVALIEQAIEALTKFYTKNGINFAQKAPEYTVDADKAPETSWGDEGGSYGGRSSESGGITAILSMIKEDLEKDMKTAAADDAEAEALYEKNRGALQNSYDTQKRSKIQKEKEAAELGEEVNDLTINRNGLNTDHGTEVGMQGTLGSDCAWTTDGTFESRRTKRKAEMDGLVEAKNTLAGSDAGEDMLDD